MHPSQTPNGIESPLKGLPDRVYRVPLFSETPRWQKHVLQTETNAAPSELISRIESPRTVLKTSQPRPRVVQKVPESSDTLSIPELQTKVPTHRPGAGRREEFHVLILISRLWARSHPTRIIQVCKPRLMFLLHVTGQKGKFRP